MSPWTMTSSTCSCFTAPIRLTLSCNEYFSLICSKSKNLGPSPAIKKSTLGLAAQILGIIAVKRSAPLFGKSLDMTTIVISDCWPAGFGGLGAGEKSLEMTAFGITETSSGSREARRTVFSLQVCETQMTWSMSVRVNLSNLFPIIDPTSAKPNKE